MKLHNIRALRGILTGILVGLAIALFFVASSAQENMGRGRIGGLVTDESGTPLEGVRVVAASTQSEAKLEAVTDKKGRFSIIGLGTGFWRFSAEKEGFDTLAEDREIFQLKPNLPLNLVLKKPRAAEESVTGVPLIDQGNEAMQNEKYDEALAFYREFQAKSPEVYGIRVNIAMALLKKGDLDGAEADFKGVLEDVLRVQGEYAKDKVVAVRALSGLGEIAFRRNDLETGRKYFTEALVLSPDDEKAAYNVGEILFSNQNIDEAIRYFEMAVSIKKDWSKPYLKLGYVYLNKGDYDRSIENFLKFIELDPENPEVPKVKGILEAIEKIKK